MIIRRALPKHSDEINRLVTRYAMPTVTPAYFNNKDIALVALDDDKVVGFVWCGMMAGGEKGLVDYFVVNPEYSGKGVGYKLALKMQKVLSRKGKDAIVSGFIRQDEHHDRSGMNALKLAMGADDYNYTHVYTSVNYSLKETANGR